MGPLVVYEIISENTNFLLAFLIGISFGFVLESNGFSSSRRLAGMFYGYDTTVLKVFFTAAITAMLGLLFMSLFGWLDLSMIYINPTFLWSAIGGGVIMGIGFILGGYCPGTSFCAASIGKLDALAFIGGLFIGVFIFTEGYPLWDDFYKAKFMGSPTLNEMIGVSRGVLTFLIILVALAMFWVGEWAEKKFARKDYTINQR
ncbi:MAG: sulfurtransferase [Bacteroidetes bacterium GWF2_42_66]|nr:MAG: sulfurtransferase [Bacteroidetes bacterium GWA2_42_15]OFX97327.1 MAG: sulfurtransferase [Bacteroidetes bacterium GWE2_42_39]OFY39964.1 MAG: sulfurtransferase [Bacteroidetes bacterium GWF2_42_66]HAZ03518.1 sulfurtransferase [Marinilabiliales bacterium]HBL78152.1 sulfurtransferase [Prolixibacteraceae bacterium]